MTDPHRPSHDEPAYREARRAAVRAHHPDAGGDADRLMRALRDVDRRFGIVDREVAGPRSTPVDVVVVTTARRRALRLVRRAGRALPRRRAYVDITPPPRP
ncbi:hypothetical protein [Rhodococcoides corynebacterioides]|uniref:Molecular chaperone DnaJ n=1 Tax=Rhodococcoides corynebacterioides TaxID=53972 RepID=A0ABS7P4U1_9NOCA|nr:hypothetical protein [Rhodococcus corynebacterioides]MBY6367441.1 hypothetical protein [Rhodococcus corynebacterioides]MBY6407133.1 hypothetical protein [Rhodococcus corynebacterioides]